MFRVFQHSQHPGLKAPRETSWASTATPSPTGPTRALRDFDRPLNARGKRGAVADGRGISAIRVRCAADRACLASPCAAPKRIDRSAVRPMAVPIRSTGTGGSTSPSSATLLDLLREQEDDPPSILMVGHNPGLEDLIFDLVPDDGQNPLRDDRRGSSFRPRPMRCWSWISMTGRIAPGCAKLIHLKRPRDLDPGLAPEPRGLGDFPRLAQRPVSRLWQRHRYEWGSDLQCARSAQPCPFVRECCAQSAASALASPSRIALSWATLARIASPG